MLGVDQISWGQFIRFLLVLLFSWYLVVILYGWLKHKSHPDAKLFEQDSAVSFFPEEPETISVSAADYPSAMIPYALSEVLPLNPGFYEATDIDNSYGLELFLEQDNVQLPHIMEQIHYQ